jgi:transposase, IS30 family
MPAKATVCRWLARNQEFRRWYALAAGMSGWRLRRRKAGFAALWKSAQHASGVHEDTIKDRVSIHERPENVDARTEGGHWEGDLIICKRSRPVLVLHERKWRVTLSARLAGKTAAETISVMLAAFARVEPALRKSITFDNDTAFAQHCCEWCAPWRLGFATPMPRGKRAGSKTPTADYDAGLPRQTDIDKVSDEEIQDIVITGNLTPRKYLGFKTPFQGILKELGKDVQIRFA